MDKLEQLYNLYVDKGILTSQTTLDQFKDSDVDIQSKLYDLGKNKGLFNTTDLNTFQSAWGDVKKKKILQHFKTQFLKRLQRILYWNRNLQLLLRST